MKIGQRIVFLSVKGEMLTVFETAAGEQRRQIVGRVSVGAAHIRAVKDGRAVEQSGALLLDAVQTA